MDKDKQESYKHYHAKKILASWLRDKEVFGNWAQLGDIAWRSNRDGPYYGVFEEYPIVEGIGTNVWDERNWWEGEEYPIKTYPDYAWMKENYKGPFKIADIAVQHKGWISYIIEITHTNPLSEEKLEFYKDICPEATIYEIPADWVLDKLEAPKEIPKKFKRYGQ